MPAFKIAPVIEEDRELVKEFIQRLWYDERVVANGKLFSPSALPGIISYDRKTIIGLITYIIEGDTCQIITLNSLVQGWGLGTVLVDAVRAAAVAAKCSRLMLLVNNDNITAFRFFQKRGFNLVAVHRNALEKAREVKPMIPAEGYNGIPMRDEMEMEVML